MLFLSRATCHLSPGKGFSSFYFEFGVDGGEGFADVGELVVQFFHGALAVGVDAGDLLREGVAGVAFRVFTNAATEA